MHNEDWSDTKSALTEEGDGHGTEGLYRSV